MPLDRINAFRAGLASWLREHCPEILALDDDAEPMADSVRARLKTSLTGLAQAVTTSAPEGQP